MNPKNTLPISEARKKIFDIADDVQKPGVYYVLTEKGRPKAVMLSFEGYDSLLEDLEMFRDPKILARMKKAEAEFERGEYITLDELKKEIQYEVKKQWVVQEKTRKKNQYRIAKQ